MTEFLTIMSLAKSTKQGHYQVMGEKSDTGFAESNNQQILQMDRFQYRNTSVRNTHDKMSPPEATSSIPMAAMTVT